MTPVIELENLSVRLGRRDILLSLTGSWKARTIGLLGPNGAGKSTLINTLLGFYPPSAGAARVFGLDIRHDARRIRSLTGYMPENDSFLGHLSAVNFVRYMAELSGLPAEAALERAHEALFYVGLGEARYRKVSTYSLGMKQLVKLAQAIVHGPKLVILDEPTNGLDPPARQRMLKLIKEMRQSGDVHLILCSHLLRDVEETCEEVIILKKGRLVHTSNLEEERRLNRRFLELEVHATTVNVLVSSNGASAQAAPMVSEQPYSGFVRDAGTLGCECADLGGGRIKMILADGVEIRDIYRLAEQHSLQLRRLSHRRDSLEDIFLKAMRDENGGL
jgi:ABC-2 type transport system ATP-binding protein